MKQSVFWVFLSIIPSMLPTSEVSAMSMFFGGEETEIVLFSPLEGKLTYEGEPAANAEISLRISWKDEEGEVFNYQADENGRFQLPRHRAAFKQSTLAQLVIKQTITVRFSKQDIEVWHLSKMKPEIFTELGGRPVNLSCELTNATRTVRGQGSLGGTKCMWNTLNNEHH